MNIRSTSKKELDNIVDYWKSLPRHNGYYTEDSFIYFLSFFNPDQIKGAMYITTSRGRHAYFKYLCGILHKWRKDVIEGRKPTFFDIGEIKNGAGR